jgi:hypothetical protein
MKLVRGPRLWFSRFGGWLKARPYRIYLFIGIVLVGVALIAAAIILLTPQPVVESTPTKVTKKQAPAPVVYYSPLTGAKVADEATTKLAVTGVMIENSPDARPQSGLKDAGIIYEAIAEGGITRFLALYQEGKPQLVGPVRSLRMYYIDWAAPYQASIAHFGGSAASLTEVSKSTYRNLDMMVGGYAWRSTDRYAPHNVYTNFANLDTYNTAKGYTTSVFTGFARKDGKTAATPDATSVDVTISSALFNPHYDYDATTNTYVRSIDGEASTDREGGQLTPSVVVALKVDMTLVMEDGWRESITTSGSGTAYVFQNGTVTECTWHKASTTEPLQLLDASGATISLNRGQTWIAAVPNSGGGVSWK